MPKLPSGISLAISRGALFDHGGNWFNCPKGHFWYWAPAPEMGQPPYDTYDEILTISKHASVPKTREEASNFVQVVELKESGKYGWRGEWLASFPKYTKLSKADLVAWREWLRKISVSDFLDEVIDECARLAEISQAADGYAVLNDVENETRNDGWAKGSLKVRPSKINGQ